MKITGIKVDFVGDGNDIDPNKGLVEPLGIITIDTDEGLKGFAESFRVPVGVARALMHGKKSLFGEIIIGEEITHPERIWQKMYDSLMHYNRRGWGIMCMGAIDIAIWDLYGKYLNQPVYKLLGGAQRGYFQTPESTPGIEVVPYCTVVSSHWDNQKMIDAQVENCVKLKDLKYRAMKLEPLMSSCERIIELATKARKVLGPDIMMAVDVGYRFNDVATAVRVCEALKELDVYFFETPFPVDFYEPYAALASRTSIPIAMGEHAVSRAECFNMFTYGKISIIQPYMSTVGGITEAKRIVDRVRDIGGLVIPGNWSTQILGCATVHMAAYSAVTPYIEFAPAEIYESPLRKRIQQMGFPVVEGAIQLPTTTGIGFEISDELIEEFKIKN